MFYYHQEIFKLKMTIKTNLKSFKSLHKENYQLILKYQPHLINQKLIFLLNLLFQIVKIYL